MPWASLIPLIISVGLPLAEKLWQKAQSGEEATQADWDELREIEAQTPLKRLEGVAAGLGLPMDHPDVKRLVDLIKAQAA